MWDNIRKILVFNLPVNLAQASSSAGHCLLV